MDSREGGNDALMSVAGLLAGFLYCWGDDEGAGEGGAVANVVTDGQVDGEGGAVSRFTGDGDVAAHHLAEAAADGQTETRAPILAGSGVIPLDEGLEELFDLLGGQADAGVADLDCESGGRGGRFSSRFENNITTFSEPGGVAEQVE